MHEKVSPTKVGEPFERAATERRVVNGSDALMTESRLVEEATEIGLHVHSCQARDDVVCASGIAR